MERLLCALGDALDALREQGATIERVILIGGGAKSQAVRRIAPAVLRCSVTVPAPSEYVADGAARQAAWTLSGETTAPGWSTAAAEVIDAPAVPAIRQRYAEVRDLTATRR